jgi:hypothetical protein
MTNQKSTILFKEIVQLYNISDGEYTLQSPIQPEYETFYEVNEFGEVSLAEQKLSGYQMTFTSDENGIAIDNQLDIYADCLVLGMSYYYIENMKTIRVKLAIPE